MASSWGSSWGTSWGDSWGEVDEEVPGQEGAGTSTATANRQHGVLANMRRAAFIIALLFLLGAF